MKFKFNIRRANINDAQSIASIGYNAWQDTYKGLMSDDALNSIDLKEQILRCEQRIKSGNNILVATDAMHYAVGYCSFGNSRDNTNPRENEIYSLYVNKDCRSMGLGSILLFEAERAFPVPKPLVVRTLKHNLRARTFYENNGFKHLPERDGTFRGVAPDVCYLKTN